MQRFVDKVKRGRRNGGIINREVDFCENSLGGELCEAEKKNTMRNVPYFCTQFWGALTKAGVPHSVRAALLFSDEPSKEDTSREGRDEEVVVGFPHLKPPHQATQVSLHIC